jgi:flagellar operon protein
VIRPILPQGVRRVDGGTISSAPGAPPASSSSFEQVLSERLSPTLKFSGHAQERIASRQVSVTPEDVRRLEDAVAVAREKGARETLVMLDRRAFIVSVPTSTVVTVMPAEAKRVFTNIDSAVWM